MSAPEVVRLAGALGATIDGRAVGDLASPTAAAVLRRLVTEHHVVFVRGAQLDDGGLERLAARFGDLSTHPLDRLLGRPRRSSVIEDTAERPPAGFPWHTDLSWLPRPPRFGFLQALEIPAVGGDTVWVGLAALYRALSSPVRWLCGGLTAVHRMDASLLATVEANHGADAAARFRAGHPPVAHPLVTAHPDTGEPCLFVSPMYVERVAELHPGESARLLGLVDDLLGDATPGVRWRWQAGDVAIWDEAATVHRALTDHHPQRRRMRRCTTVGDAPVPWCRP